MSYEAVQHASPPSSKEALRRRKSATLILPVVEASGAALVKLALLRARWQMALGRQGTVNGILMTTSSIDARRKGGQVRQEGTDSLSQIL
jgi:hypothetical protein